MIHVCYGLHDGDGRYSKFTGTSILSMFENATTPPRSLTVHILHDDTLTADNRDKFSYLAGQYNQIIKFYNVEKICAAELEEIKKLFVNELNRPIFSVGKFYRLLTPQLFDRDIEKIIYLDSDIIVNLDISDLWKIQLEDKSIAAVPEMENGVKVMDYVPSCQKGIVDPNDYFNSGVVVLNLKQIRQSEMDNLHEKIIFRAENPQYIYYDQEILNYCFSTNYLILPNRFNFFVRESTWRNEFKTENRILHYLSGSVNLNMHNAFCKLWFKYLKKTCWFNEDVIAHFYEELIKLNVQLKDLAVQTSAIMSGKSRVFFTAEGNVERLRQVFYLREGEEIIPAVNEESVQILKESMKASAGKKLYFMLVGEGYYFLRADLINEGFVEGRDFVNAMQFLSDAHGIPLDTYNFVKAL